MNNLALEDYCKKLNCIHYNEKHNDSNNFTDCCTKLKLQGHGGIDFYFEYNSGISSQSFQAGCINKEKILVLKELIEL